ncbi:hypothetical protein S7S_16100 [Isoalcanivorax pacificus W11-5]|uniref:Ferritin Dps family protein n=1 Tax=Isoalcanivorax pacificus W11-5 TaxID=391936 RepID=A0A0B4XTK3_9GAMM|nr:ferritin-like domain-containing protein [Isoalcanivorax pacificus]AJD49632.1 hypothetical protein S7S_16100 [Isoalcanivorax pacificus W11-5]
MSHSSIGMNRTGIQMSPLQSQQQTDIAEDTAPTLPGDASDLASARQRHISPDDSIGSVPLPGSLKGAVKTTVQKVTGHHPAMLIDKLGERLAFERNGVRLYDALIAKATALAVSAERIARLHHFRGEEAEHMERVKRAMEQIGADPTAQTPAADVAGVAAIGVLQVITDPRTSFSQSLDALLTAELTDNAAWELLIDMARDAGQQEMVSSFTQALEQEQDHLGTVRIWLREELDLQGA